MNTSVVWTGSRLIFIQLASMSYDLGLTVIPPGVIRLACWASAGLSNQAAALLASLWARIPVASLPHAERFELDEVNRAAKRINQGAVVTGGVKRFLRLAASCPKWTELAHGSVELRPP